MLIFTISILDTGYPLFFQERIGLNKKTFLLVKFRTMKLNAKSVATHLASQSDITKLGLFLRKTKIDELPQLWNVLLGQMSFVGPRPNLPSQDELIHEREKLNVYSVKPGITGLAQIERIDMSQPQLLAKTDHEMVKTMTIKTYFEYIFKTIFGRGRGDVLQ
tara:strand:+ start:102 stop:587 length:486 start_codon:yes stop_codon:yes gene_type:complete